MKTKITILLLFVASSLSAQNWGGFAHVASETFYRRNLSVSAGVRYKEVRLGAYYQSAFDTENTFIRKGIIAEAGILNVDEVAYFSLGARVVTTNNRFVEVIPHLTTSFRFNRYVEVPIVLSTYHSAVTASIG